MIALDQRANVILIPKSFQHIADLLLRRILPAVFPWIHPNAGRNYAGGSFESSCSEFESSCSEAAIRPVAPLFSAMV